MMTDDDAMQLRSSITRDVRRSRLPGKSVAGVREKACKVYVNRRLSLSHCISKPRVRLHMHHPITVSSSCSPPILRPNRHFAVCCVQGASSRCRPVALQALSIRGSYTSASSSFANTSEVLLPL